MAASIRFSLPDERPTFSGCSIERACPEAKKQVKRTNVREMILLQPNADIDTVFIF